MNPTRLLLTTLLAGGSAAVVGCHDTAPLEVNTPAAGSLLGDLGQLLTLLPCNPLPESTATATIGPAGGTLQVGPHTLTVPAGALSAPVSITGTAPSGSVNTVQFQPEGLRFAVPAGLTMSYANCPSPGVLLPKRVVFTDDALTILEVLLSVDSRSAQTVVGRVQHFSHYAVAY